MRLLLLAISCTLAFLGCASRSGVDASTSGSAAAPAVAELRLYISRASSNQTDYEQYTAQSGQLFKECGEIKRGRFTSNEQDVAPLGDKHWQEISSLVSTLNEIALGRGLVLDPPGTNRNLMDPGQYTLVASWGDGSLEVRTSFDSVSNSEGRTEGYLKRLAQLVRDSAGLPLCGHTSFYGLEPLR